MREAPETAPKKNIGGTKKAKADWTMGETRKRPPCGSFRWEKICIGRNRTLSVKRRGERYMIAMALDAMMPRRDRIAHWK